MTQFDRRTLLRAGLVAGAGVAGGRCSARPARSPPNTSPAEGFQHFGEVSIDGESAALTVHLRDRTGASPWTTTPPRPADHEVDGDVDLRWCR